MPLEIRELVIKATISQDDSGSAKPTAGTQSGNSPATTEQMVQTCVEKVLEILKTKNQR
jgi:hypothetical protein